MKHKYIPSRLVRYAEMGDYKFKYIEAPRCLAHNMAGVPVSVFEHGVIVTDRFLLQSHLERAGLTRWTQEHELQARSLSGQKQKGLTDVFNVGQHAK
jgi:hypothetical protein